MKELKHTIDLENYIVNDLKTDKDIKLYLNTSLKDYIEDGDFNSFYRALEIALHSFALIFCHHEFILGSILLTKPVLAQCKKVQKSAILF